MVIIINRRSFILCHYNMIKEDLYIDTFMLYYVPKLLPIMFILGVLHVFGSVHRGSDDYSRNVDFRPCFTLFKKTVSRVSIKIPEYCRIPTEAATVRIGTYIISMYGYRISNHEIRSGMC